MSYTVKSGDTLSKIATQLGLTGSARTDWFAQVGPTLRSGDINRIGIGEVIQTPDEFASADEPTTPAEEAPGFLDVGLEPEEEVDAGGGVTVKAGAPAAEKQAEVGVGTGSEDPETQLTILTGQNMRWYLDKGTGKWYVQYGFGERNRAIFFEAEPEQMDALFGAGMRPTQYSAKHTLASLSGLEHMFFGGNVSEMEGTGTFEAEYERIKAIALDNGILPEWAQGDAANDIMFVAQTEGKSNDWVVERLSNLPEFKARFPGLDKIKSEGNLTTVEAVSGFLELEAGVRQALSTTGGDTSTVTPALVGELINGGHSLTTVQKTVKTFDRMEKFAPAMAAFNEILGSQGLPQITDIQGMFDFMAGEAPSEMYDIYEASSIQESAVAAGLGDIFTPEYAMSTALATDQTLESATAASKKAAEMLLRLRHEVNVGEFGLDHEELLDISFGRAPTSGRSEAEVGQAINRAILKAQGDIQTKRATPYKSFGPTGSIKAASLGNLRPQT